MNTYMSNAGKTVYVLREGATAVSVTIMRLRDQTYYNPATGRFTSSLFSIPMDLLPVSMRVYSFLPSAAERGEDDYIATFSDGSEPMIINMIGTDGQSNLIERNVRDLWDRRDRVRPAELTNG